MRSKFEICKENYRKWKQIAFSSNNLKEIKTALKRAFFWIEMYIAFLALHAIENSTLSKEAERKIIEAKAKICEKLVDYAEELLKEFES